MIEKFIKSISPESLVGSDYEKIGIGGFSLYASASESFSKTATITSNPVESGVMISDHIIKNPTNITITGEVADIFIEKPKPLLIQRLVPAIGIIQDYLPSRTLTQIGKVNGLLATANDFYIAADVAVTKGVQLFDLFKGNEADDTITSIFFEFFDAIFETSSVIDVECSDKIFTNMVISSFSTSKLNENNYSFTITLQKIIEAETTLIKLTKNASGDATAQGAELADKGTQQASNVDESFASALIGAFK